MEWNLRGFLRVQSNKTFRFLKELVTMTSRYRHIFLIPIVANETVVKHWGFYRSTLLQLYEPTRLRLPIFTIHGLWFTPVNTVVPTKLGVLIKLKLHSITPPPPPPKRVGCFIRHLEIGNPINRTHRIMSLVIGTSELLQYMSHKSTFYEIKYVT